MAYLLLVVVVGSTLVQVLKWLAGIETLLGFSSSAKLDDFRIWAQHTCTEPWQRETLLCQAVEGNWLARQLGTPPPKESTTLPSALEGTAKLCPSSYAPRRSAREIE